MNGCVENPLVVDLRQLHVLPATALYPADSDVQ